MTFENLETVFKKSNKPYWYLFKGNTRGTVLASAFFEDEEPDNAKAWDQLAEIMREFDDGTYSVELRTTPNTSRNNPFITFQMGDTRPANSAQAATVAGAEPRGFMSGLSMQYFLEQNRRDWTEIQDLKMAVLKKEFELQQLKSDQDRQEQPDLIGRVVGLVEKNPNILVRLLGGGPEAKTAIGLLKAEKPIGTATVKATDNDDDAEEYEDEPPGNISIDRAVNCLVRLQKVFPDRNVNQLLEDLTDFCEEDPEKAAQILDYL